jgi:hypothetical protein
MTHGTNTLLGLDPARISEVPKLLGQTPFDRMPPLWDGHAGERAGEAIVEKFG